MIYSYEEFKKDLLMGREIEFYYNNSKYSVSNNKEGWYLTKFYDVNDQAFKNIDDLLAYGCIDSKKIKEIWDLIKIDTIF